MISRKKKRKKKNQKQMLLVVLLFAFSFGVVVNTTSGVLRGFSSGGLDFFLGVPFGTQQRFQASLPFPAWQGERPAYLHGPQCPQIPPQMGGGSAPASEDCLFLDVYRPSGGVGINKTLIWIHGGAFMSGNAIMYDASALARNGALVFVIQYRLGAFGFLPQAPNLGSMDQLLAINYVLNNTVAFGGDLSKITLSGQSAGGGSSLALVTSPLLPKGSISAVAALSPFLSQQLRCADVLPFGDLIFEFANCSTLSCLASVDTQVIVDAFVNLPNSIAFPFSPCVDGALFTAPYSALLSELPKQTLISQVVTEGGFFAWINSAAPPGPMNDAPSRVTDLILGLQNYSGVGMNLTTVYPPSNGTWLAFANLQGDYNIACLAWRMMREVASHPVLFNSFLPGNPTDFLGPTHIQDIPFWFNNASVPNGNVSPGFDGPHAELAERMARYLVSFDDAQPSPPFDQYKIFSDTGDTFAPFTPMSTACKVWNNLFPNIRHVTD